MITVAATRTPQLTVESLRLLHLAGGVAPSYQTLYNLCAHLRTVAHPPVVDCVGYLVHDLNMGWCDDPVRKRYRDTPIFDRIIHHGMCATLHVGITAMLDMGAPCEPALLRAVQALDVPCVKLILGHRNMKRDGEIDWSRVSSEGYGWIGQVVHSSYVARNLGQSAATVMTMLLVAGATPIEVDNKGRDLLSRIDTVSRAACPRNRHASSVLPRMRAPLQQWMARATIGVLAMGTHKRVGADSAVLTALSSSPLYGPQVWSAHAHY